MATNEFTVADILMAHVLHAGIKDQTLTAPYPGLALYPKQRLDAGLNRRSNFFNPTQPNPTQPNPTKELPITKNTIRIWCDTDAEAAAHFYAKTFPDSAVEALHHAPSDYPGG